MIRHIGLLFICLNIAYLAPAEAKDCREDLQKEVILVEVGRGERCWGLNDEWCRSEWNNATGGRKHLLIFKNVSNRPQALLIFDWPFIEAADKWPSFSGGELVTVAPAASDTFRIRPGARKGIHYIHNIGCRGALDSLEAKRQANLKGQQVGPGVIVE